MFMVVITIYWVFAVNVYSKDFRRRWIKRANIRFAFVRGIKLRRWWIKTATSGPSKS